MSIRQAFREIRRGIVVMWWGFFDWVAVVSWKALLLVSFLSLIIGGIFKLPMQAFVLIVASFIIKVVAGGKRRAELTATQANRRAETEQLERTVLEARMESLQAQIEPRFLFPAHAGCSASAPGPAGFERIEGTDCNRSNCPKALAGRAPCRTS